MNLTDITALLQKNYGITITPQALYNWIKKYDLLKFRGKGRRLNANLQKPQGQKQRPNPAREREKRARQASKARKGR